MGLMFRPIGIPQTTPAPHPPKIEGNVALTPLTAQRSPLSVFFALFKFLVDCKLLDKSEVEGVICNIHSLGARDFSPSYGLAPRVFVGLKSHAPIDFVARQLPIYWAVAVRLLFDMLIPIFLCVLLFFCGINSCNS